MNKRLLFSVFTLITLTIISVVVYDVNHISKEEYHELVKNHPMQERLKLSKKERKKMGIPPNRYFDDQYLLEMDPATGKTRPENLLEVRRNKKTTSARFTGVPGQNRELTWQERGPLNIGGRTRVAFFDPNDPTGKRVFAGGVSGGLWVNNDITNVNSQWSQIGIDENLSISCYAIDPNDSNIWYVGTGEVYTQDDGVGNGIWKTTNGGATWEPILTVNLDLGVGNRPYFINQIVAWDKSNTGVTELFVSIDGQRDNDFVGFRASGWWTLKSNGFERISFLTDGNNPYVFSDIEVAKDNSLWLSTRNNIFGNGGGKIFRTTDGVNFTEKYSFANGDRVELTTSKLNANTVYALASTNESESVELIKTIDGVNFTTLSKPNDVDVNVPANDFARSQGFYNLTIEIDPENNEIVYVGGINLFKTDNGGSTWQQISKWVNDFGLEKLDIPLVHADHHAVVFNPRNNSQAVFANDGGIYFCQDLSSISTNSKAIQQRNFGYNITQFYSGAIGQSRNTELLLGGAQDNGSLFGVIPVNSTSFEPKVSPGQNYFIDIFSGDGIENFIDKDGKYVIVSFVNNVYGLHKLPLSSDNDIVTISEDQDTGTFANEADLDDNLDILYTNGTTNEGRGTPRIHRYSNITESPNRTILSNSLLSELPTAIKVSPYTAGSSTVFIGTEGATLLKVTNANTNNATWTKIAIDEAINVGAISDIDFGRNENEILVTLHNYGINNIYYTNNGGAKWEVKDGGFPDIPVKAIKMNPLNASEVIIGTNAGVWRTESFLSKNPKWQQSQNGMSSVKVTKFDMRTSDNTVLAATYGRGLFTSRFTEKIKLDLSEEVTIESGLAEDGKIELQFSDKVSSFVTVTFYSMRGQLVGTQQIDPNTAANQIIETSFVPGVYIMNLSSDQGSRTQKIIVTNQ